VLEKQLGTQEVWMEFFTAKRKLFKFLFPLGISLFLISPQNLKITQSPLQFLSPPSQVPIPAETIKTLKEIQVLFDQLVQLLKEAEDFTLDGDFELKPLRQLIENRNSSFDNLSNKERALVSATNYFYLLYLYFIVDISNTSFMSSEVYQSNSEKVEEIIDLLGRKFQSLSPFLHPRILNYRDMWIKYHQKMIGGILHESQRGLYALSTYLQTYEIQKTAESLSPLKKGVVQILPLTRYMSIITKDGYTQSKQLQEGNEEDWVSIEEANIFLRRYYLYKLGQVAKELNQQALKMRQQDLFSTLSTEAKEFIDLTVEAGQVTWSLISFYLKGEEFPLERISIIETIKSTVEKFEKYKGRSLSDIIELDFQNEINLFVKGNSILLQQAILNLILNATDHAKAKKILIRGFQDDDEAVIEITNDSSNGRFIPPEMLEPVPFYGVKGVRLARLFAVDFTTSKEIGRGFGTKLAWQFVHSHGGALEVRSNQEETQSLGKTIFTIRMSLLKPEEPKSKESARLGVTIPGESSAQAVSPLDLTDGLRDLLVGLEEESGTTFSPVKFEWKDHPAAGLFVDASL